MHLTFFAKSGFEMPFKEVVSRNKIYKIKCFAKLITEKASESEIFCALIQDHISQNFFENNF